MEKKKISEEEASDLKISIEKLSENIAKLSESIQEMKEESMGGRAPDRALTETRRRILKLLEEEERPLTVREVASLIGRAETTISGYLFDLYEGGYIERRSRLINVDESRRVRQLEYFIPIQKRRRWNYL